VYIADYSILECVESVSNFKDYFIKSDRSEWLFFAVSFLSALTFTGPEKNWILFLVI